DWMAHDYWSGNADEPYYNFPNWQNSSFDMWRDQLLHATDYDDVYEAAIEMQKVWTYECPCIIIYENQYFTAHRTDTFEVFASDISKGACSWWTNFKSHLIDGPLGGTLRWSTPLYTDSFNIMLSSSAYTMDVLQMLYDSLFKLGPENNPIPWLVESYTIKTHVDDPIVLEDHTRFTFDIIRNATWSDGNPLTAEDIAFSLNYYRINSSHPFSNDLSDMTAVYAPTKTQLIVEFETESYWHINKFAFKPVIPMHKFVNRTWNEWDPVPPYDEMVTSGPFNVTAYTAGEFVELSRNPNYHYQPSYYTTTTTSSASTPEPSSETESTSTTTFHSTSSTTSTTSSPTTTSTTSSPTTPNSTTPDNWLPTFLEGLGVVITMGSMMVIVVFGVLIFMSRRK
ncbi:MAG: ABC transporter substrate-binding protein, partial [Candidatus Thorarchaeota archaeon]